MSREIFRRLNYFVVEDPEYALQAMRSDLDEEINARGDFYVRLDNTRVTEYIQEIGAKAVGVAEHLLRYSSDRNTLNSYYYEDTLEEGIVSTQKLGDFRIRKKQEVDPPQSTRYELFVYNPALEAQLDVGPYYESFRVCEIEPIDYMYVPDAAVLTVSFSAFLAIANDRNYFWQPGRLSVPKD